MPVCETFLFSYLCCEGAAPGPCGSAESGEAFQLFNSKNRNSFRALIGQVRGDERVVLSQARRFSSFILLRLSLLMCGRRAQLRQRLWGELGQKCASLSQFNSVSWKLCLCATEPQRQMPFCREIDQLRADYVFCSRNEDMLLIYVSHKY